MTPVSNRLRKVSRAVRTVALATAVGGWAAPTLTAQQAELPPRAASAAVAKDSRVFQLRTYTAAPGKFEPLLARMRDVAAPAFRKAGMEIIGFWVSAEKPDTLVYMLAFKDRPSAERAWKTLGANAEFLAALKASEVNGRFIEKIDAMYIDPTTYSPLK